MYLTGKTVKKSIEAYDGPLQGHTLRVKVLIRPLSFTLDSLVARQRGLSCDSVKIVKAYVQCRG